MTSGQPSRLPWSDWPTLRPTSARSSCAPPCSAASRPERRGDGGRARRGAAPAPGRTRPESWRRFVGSAARRRSAPSAAAILMAATADIAAFIKNDKLFREFTDSELLAFAARLDERTLKQGQLLFRESDPGAEMFAGQKGTTNNSRIVSGRDGQGLSPATARDLASSLRTFDPS